MFYVYILESKIKLSLYTGYTENLKRRLDEHNKGLNRSTKNDLPWRLIYYEACINKNDAMRREGYLKTTQRHRLMKRRLKEYFYIRKGKDLTS